MPRRIRVHQVDAFTTQPLTGNPATVVPDAAQLSDEDMLVIAHELTTGDTAFVLPADGTDHDLRVRFFTPRGEAAFIGHATLATHAVLASLPGAQAGTLRQKQRSGLVSVTTQPGPDGTARVSIALPAPQLGAALPPEQVAAVLAALGLTSADLDPRAPVQLAGSGNTRLLIPLADGATLAGLAPDLPRLAALSPQLGAPGYFVFSRASTLPGCDTEARMFCPALGIDEDPVSGNAHGMLGVYLLAHGLLPATAGGFRGAQGHHMGRPGHVDIGFQRVGGGLGGVTLQGDAVILFETTMTLQEDPHGP